MTTPALLTDHYELTMVKAALRSGAADRRCVFEVFARSLPGAAATASSPDSAVSSTTLPRFRFDDDDAVRFSPAASDRQRDRRVAVRRTDSPVDRLATPRARSTSRARLCSRSRAASPSASSWRRWCCRSSTTTARSRPRLPDGLRRRRRGRASRWVTAYPRGGGGRERPRGVHRRLRRDLEPRRRRPLGHADDRHGRARLHPGARRRARRVRGAGRRARHGDHTARRHLRRRAGRARTRSRSPDRSSARSGSTPATSRTLAAACAGSSTSSARPTPASS